MKKTIYVMALLLACSGAVAQSDTLTMAELLVTGTRSATTAERLPATVSVIDRQTLTQAERQNVLPTLSARVPGLFVTSRGVMGYGVSDGAAGGIGVRGLSSGAGRVLVLIDGQPQYQGIFGHAQADAYQTLMAERVEVMRGPASVLYGSHAMGGVVNIITRGMQHDGSRSYLNLGLGSWNTTQAEVGNQLRKGRFASTVAAQYGRSDNHRPDMAFEQYGAFAKVTYDLSDHWKRFADIDVTHFQASNPGSLASPLTEAEQWITRGAAALGLSNRYAKTNGRISVYHNFGFHKINDGYGPSYNGDQPQTELFRSHDALSGVSAYQSYHIAEGLTLTGGLEYQHIYGKAYYTSRATGEVVTAGRRGKQSTHAHGDEMAAYVDVREDVFSWLTLDAGVRYDHLSHVGGEWVPQAGVLVRPMRDADIKLTCGKGFRNPTPRELYLYGTANEALRPERLWNTELSWHHRLLGGRLTYGVNLFVMEGDNMIQTAMQGGKLQNVNTGAFTHRGAEVEASWAINRHWALHTNHSFLDMDVPVLASPEYKGYLAADMRYGRFSATAGVQCIKGLYTDLAERTTERFTLLDLTLAYQASSVVRLWMRGDNLLAQRYETMRGYPMPKATCMAGVGLTF